MKYLIVLYIILLFNFKVKSNTIIDKIDTLIDGKNKFDMINPEDKNIPNEIKNLLNSESERGNKYDAFSTNTTNNVNMNLNGKYENEVDKKVNEVINNSFNKSSNRPISNNNGNNNGNNFNNNFNNNYNIGNNYNKQLYINPQDIHANNNIPIFSANTSAQIPISSPIAGLNLLNTSLSPLSRLSQSVQSTQTTQPIIKDKKYEQLELELKLKNSNSLFTNTKIADSNDSEAIFNHIFINQNGDNEVPGSTDNLFYDGFNNEFILPVEILKEDDITKLMRIDSVLKSINFSSDSNANNNIGENISSNNEESSREKILNPPILEGVEIGLIDSQKEEKEKELNLHNNHNSHNFKRNQHLRGAFSNMHSKTKSGITKIIKTFRDNNFLQLDDNLDKSVKIMQPPNFLY